MQNLSGSNPVLANVSFVANYAAADGGGVFSDSSSPILTNVTLSGNQAQRGGGVSSYDSNPLIQNSIFWANRASSNAQMANLSGSAPTIRYSLIQDGLPQGSVDGGANLDTDPRFVRPSSCGVDDQCTDDPNTESIDESADDDYGDLRLMQPVSPAIDVGDNDADLHGTGAMTETISSIPTDLGGLPRIAAVKVATATVDLGAYEAAASSAPFFTSLPATATRVGDPYVYEVTTADPDVNEARTLAAPVLPGWLALTDRGDGTATLAGTPSAADAGEHAVTLRVEDADSKHAEQSFSILVSEEILYLPGLGR